MSIIASFYFCCTYTTFDALYMQFLSIAIYHYRCAFIGCYLISFRDNKRPRCICRPVRSINVRMFRRTSRYLKMIARRSTNSSTLQHTPLLRWYVDIKRPRLVVVVIIIIITTTMFMLLSSWPKSLREFTWVHLMNVDWAPGGHQTSDQANGLGLWVRRKLAATIHIHHRHCCY